MCLICVQFNNGKLTPEEALRNFKEMRSGMDPDHAEKVEEMLVVPRTYNSIFVSGEGEGTQNPRGLVRLKITR